MKIEDAQARCLEIENEIEERRLDLAGAQVAARAAIDDGDVTAVTKAAAKVDSLTQIIAALEKRREKAQRAVEVAVSEARETDVHLELLERQISALRFKSRQLDAELPDLEHRVTLLRETKKRSVATVAALEAEIAAIKSGEMINV